MNQQGAGILGSCCHSIINFDRWSKAPLVFHPLSANSKFWVLLLTIISVVCHVCVRLFFEVDNA